MKLSNTIADLLSATLYNGLHCDSLDRNLIEVLLCHECDYYTAPIARVVWDIQQKCHARQPGIFTYHSNLNPRNKRSADDPYVLLVSKDRWIFLDINRKWTYTYLYNEGEGQC